MQTEEPSKTDNFNWPSIWLVIAVVLTIAYVAVIWNATFSTSTIVNGEKVCGDTGWLAYLFGCLTLNELGDYLAGAFAPLAFIWLAAAVLIQSQELKAQRQELRLTRQSVDDNREVMQAQANEARKQAEYIGQQTDILKNEQQSRNDAKTSRVFDAAIRRLSGSMIDNPTATAFSIPRDKSVKTHPHRLHSFGADAIEKIRNAITHEDRIRSVSNLLTGDKFEDFKNLSDESTHSIATKDDAGFEKVFYACEEAVNLVQNLPEESRVVAETIGLKDLFEVLVWLGANAENVHCVPYDYEIGEVI